MGKTVIPYRRALDKYAKTAARKLNATAVVVFGSAARGSFGVGSDLDVAVIAPDLPPSFLERLRILNELNPTNAPIEAVGYTPSEFERMIDRRHPTALFVLEDGVPLKGAKYIHQLRGKLRELKKQWHLVRVDAGWDIQP